MSNDAGVSGTASRLSVNIDGATSNTRSATLGV